MAKKNKILISVIIGLVSSWILFSASLKEATGRSEIPFNISFSSAGNVMYFFDREKAKIYRYNLQGKLTKTYVIKKLGKDLDLKKN